MSFRPTEEQRRILDHNHELHAARPCRTGYGKKLYGCGIHGATSSGPPEAACPAINIYAIHDQRAVQKMAEVVGAETIVPSTIHSFAIFVLLANGGLGSFPEPLRIADDWENQQIVLPCLSRRLATGTRETAKHIQEMASAWQSLDE